MSVINHPVVFSTSTQHVLPPSKYLIPATWARFQLSQLINKTLGLAQPTPFDFLIRGQVLRGTIAEWCAANGVKEEETLEIEYFESLLPPKHLSSFGEEWISSVSCQLNGYILAGSYDSTVRVYDHSQRLLHTIGGHSGPVTCVTWLNKSLSTNSSGQSLLSASHDGTAQIIQIPEIDAQMDPEPAHYLASLRLHTSPLSSVTANSQETHILTAGWDGLLGLFSTEIPTEDEVPVEDTTVSRKKRRKVEPSAPKAKTKAPVNVLKGHSGKVTRGRFDKSGKKAYSCSFDSTLKTWDVELGVCTNTITSNSRPMTDLAITSDESTILACSSDRIVAVYDLRDNPKPEPPTLLSHPAYPSSICSHPISPFKAAVGSYDGVVRLWDIRSAKAPINAFKTAGRKTGNESDQPEKLSGPKKILSVDWTTGLLAVGGEAGIDMWRVSESG